jgi:NAD(P)-dependent dehydrogenase (short-subunit alcohol dehydrogenase family)
MGTRAALVTGGGHGIGHAISRRLALEQPVLVVGRDGGRLSDAKAAIEAAGGTCEVVAGDLTDTSTLDVIRSRLTSLDWTVSSLVLNAATWETGKFVGFPRATFTRMLDVNVTANWDLLQLFLPEMEAENFGRIVVNVGVVGVKAFGRDAAYVATKHALFGLTAPLAAEYSGKDIRFFPFCTGFVEGERTNAVIRSIADRSKKPFEEVYENVGKRTPAGRIISLTELAEAVAACCAKDTAAKSGEPITLVAASGS